MTKKISTTTVTLEERVTRLRTDLSTTPQGQSTMMELLPAKMVQADQSIVDFSDWGQKSNGWLEED